MNHINCLINISINMKTYSINYAYTKNTTFQDLLEYFSYLYPELNICQCYHFMAAVPNAENFNISKFYKIADCSKFLNNLLLYTNGPKCKNYYEKCLLQSKFSILGNMKKINDDFNNQISAKNKTINDLNKKIDDLNKKNTLLVQGINGNLETIEWLKQFGFNIKEFLQEGKQIENKIQKGKPHLQPNLNVDKPKFVDFYDVIVHIDSIKDINKGWKIEMSKNAKKNYNYLKNQNVLKIGVIGNANKGKSFMLSKISKIELPSGMSIKTEGLSIKYPDLRVFTNRKIVLLDSAGLETPVLVSNDNVKNDNKNENKKNEKKNDKKNELFREKSREKLITELFLQNYIVNNSDILIVVVDSLSFSEQKLLMKVKKEMERSKKVIPLYIIHNLKSYSSKKQVEDYIKETLLKSATFTLEEGHKITVDMKEITGTYFYEVDKDKDKLQKTFHLLYAYEGSEAGRIYNKFTLSFIEKSYQQVTYLESFDVIETLKDRYIKVSKDIIEKNENTQTLTMESFENSEINNSKIIKLKDEKEIVLKKCLIDELGFSNFKANGFEPMYNIYNKDNKIIVKVEAPGNCTIKSKIDIQGEYNIIKLTGEKMKDEEPESIEKNIFNLRESGKYILEIPLKFSEYRLSTKKPKITNENGVFIVEYDLDAFESDD